MKWLLPAVAVVFLLAPTPAAADDLGNAMNVFCEMIKSCTLVQMGKQQNLTPEIRQMVENQMQTMCVGVQQQYVAATRTHELYEPAVACMRSMSALECPQLQSANADATPACATYKEKAKNYQ